MERGQCRASAYQDHAQIGGVDHQTQRWICSCITVRCTLSLLVEASSVGRLWVPCLCENPYGSGVDPQSPDAS